MVKYIKFTFFFKYNCYTKFEMKLQTDDKTLLKMF